MNFLLLLTCADRSTVYVLFIDIFPVKAKTPRIIYVLRLLWPVDWRCANTVPGISQILYSRHAIFIQIWHLGSCGMQTKPCENEDLIENEQNLICKHFFL